MSCAVICVYIYINLCACILFREFFDVHIFSLLRNFFTLETLHVYSNIHSHWKTLLLRDNLYHDELIADACMSIVCTLLL